MDYFRPDLARSYPSAPAAYKRGACPPDDPTVEGVDVCKYDFAQLAPLGYNVIRLNISWSLLEPTPGTVDSVYLNRIAQVVALEEIGRSVRAVESAVRASLAAAATARSM